MAKERKEVKLLDIKGIEVYSTGDMIEKKQEAKPIFTVTKTATGGVRVVLDSKREKIAKSIYSTFSALNGLRGKGMKEDLDGWLNYMYARTQNVAYITRSIEDTEHDSSNELEKVEDDSTLQYKLDL